MQLTQVVWLTVRGRAADTDGGDVGHNLVVDGLIDYGVNMKFDTAELGFRARPECSRSGYIMPHKVVDARDIQAPR